MTHIQDIIRALRPYQWIKNVLVFAGLFFSLSLFNGPLVMKAVMGFLSFVFASSSVYLFNDIIDIKEDRLHPVKKHRPIPAGRISRTEAILLSVTLFILAILIPVLMINYWFVGIIIAYLLVNISYSFYLKRFVILDVFMISIGFLLRAMAGIVAIEVKISPWIIICTFLLALFLALGKRRGEFVELNDKAEKHRKSLKGYSLAFIDNLLGIVCASTIVTYALYTIADDTVERFQTQMLILTTPVVIYMVFRYLYMLQYKEMGEDPTKMIFNDRPLIIGGLIWVVMVGLIIYLKLQLRFYL